MPLPLDLQISQQRDLLQQRWDWLLRNPDGARHLLHLLSLGKGTRDDFEKMVDRMVASEQAAIAQARKAT